MEIYYGEKKGYWWGMDAMKYINSIVPGPFGMEDVFDFGKYRAMTVADVFDENWRYVDWCVSNIDWFILDEKAQTKLDEIINEEEFDIDPRG